MASSTAFIAASTSVSMFGTSPTVPSCGLFNPLPQGGEFGFGRLGAEDRGRDLFAGDVACHLLDARCGFPITSKVCSQAPLPFNDVVRAHVVFLRSVGWSLLGRDEGGASDLLMAHQIVHALLVSGDYPQRRLGTLGAV